MSDYVEFRKVRDFGDVINVTFTFLRQNLVLLGKSLLLIVGPLALIGGLSSMGMWDQMKFELNEAGGLSDEFGAGLFGLSYLLFIGLSLLSTVISVTVVNSYMILYQDQGLDSFMLEDVWNLVKERFWMMLGTSFFAIFIYFGGAMILIVPPVIVLAAVISTSATSTILMGILIFIISILWIVGFFYFIVIISLLFPIRMHESIGLIESFNRSRYLIRNNYGNSFAVLMVSGILMTVLGLLFSAPGYLLTFLGGFHAFSDGEVTWVKYPLTMVSVLSSLGSSLLYAIPSTAMALQYFSLVEKKEKAGLMSRIDGLDEGEDDLF